MPPTGSIFTDWQQVDNERRLLMDEDFSWSDSPSRPRRRHAEVPVRRRRLTAVAEAEPVERDPRGEASETHSEFDEVMQRWNEAYGDASRTYRVTRGAPRGREEQMSYAGHIEAAALDHGDAATFDRDDVASYAHAPVHEDRSGADDFSGGYDLSEPEQSDRRTVVITGRGDDRYMPARRRRPSSELRFHERSGFSPDRTAMWAVLLGLALLIGAVVH
jgi:hypothetical protein